MRHFWNWVKNADETRTLFLEGVIAEESWFSDEVTPAMFNRDAARQTDNRLDGLDDAGDQRSANERQHAHRAGQ